MLKLVADDTSVLSEEDGLLDRRAFEEDGGVVAVPLAAGADNTGELSTEAGEDCAALCKGELAASLGTAVRDCCDEEGNDMRVVKMLGLGGGEAAFGEEDTVAIDSPPEGLFKEVVVGDAAKIVGDPEDVGGVKADEIGGIGEFAACDRENAAVDGLLGLVSPMVAAWNGPATIDCAVGLAVEDAAVFGEAINDDGVGTGDC